MKTERINAFTAQTGKCRYVLLTEKRKLTMNIVVSFIWKIAENQEISKDKLEAILSREGIQAMRKNIVPCYYDDLGDDIHITVGKSETICNKAEAIVFRETNRNDPLIEEIFTKGV